MSNLRTAAQQALEALEYLDVTAEHWVDDRIPDAAIKALRAALAEEALQRLTDANQEIEAVLEQQEQTEQTNPWRDAVDDELVSLHMVASDDPRESIRRLIDWHCAVQIDPLVSSAAQELIERGKREALEPEQGPVAWMDPNSGEVCRAHWLESHAPERDVDRFSCPLYTHPPRREQPKFTLSCGCPSQYGGVPAYWDRDGSTAFGMVCERHWHEYGARSNA
jgi:hypothetical protein